FRSRRRVARSPRHTPHPAQLHPPLHQAELPGRLPTLAILRFGSDASRCRSLGRPAPPAPARPFCAPEPLDSLASCSRLRLAPYSTERQGSTDRQERLPHFLR